MVKEITFTHNGMLYESAYLAFICSGEFADALKQHFNMQKDDVLFFFPTLKHFENKQADNTGYRFG